MRIFWKKVWLLGGALALIWLLSGCSFTASAESLFTLPQLPIEYTDLSGQIQDLIADGYEYASPTGGRNIQSVQMVDLDGDGDEEAVAFFRRSTDEKPLKIFIFRSNEDSYEKLCTVESSGTAIDSVNYNDLNGDGKLELIVGWRISSDVQTVAVYAVDAQPATLLQSGYIRYSIEELDGDGIPSLLLFRADEEGNSIAEFYSWRGDGQTGSSTEPHGEGMAVSHSANLSCTMAELTRGSVVSGPLTQDVRAVFVTGINDEGIATTDILTYRQGTGLVNVALDPRTGRSGVVCPYMQLKPQDIDGDGLIEVPEPHGGKDGQPTGIVEWLWFDENGRSQRAMTTYHNLSGGWYFVLPGQWTDRVQITNTERGTYETQTTLLVDGNEILSVYTLAGENRENRALRGNRVVLKRQTGTIYAGELLSGAKDYGLTEDTLRQNFRLIVNQWTNG